MRLALHTDYGLRTLMYLAGVRKRATVGEIAQFFAISKDHLAKVAQRLTRLGFIRSVRGIGGGLELAVAADSVTIGDVIQKLEGSMQLLDCVRSQTEICVIQSACRLRKVLGEAERLQMEYLNSIKLSDLARTGSKLNPSPPSEP